MKAVITGGTHSGKSSLITELGKEYHILSETAMEIISELNDKLGTEGQMKWRSENQPEFQSMVAKRQLQRETELADDGVLFLDGGVHDSIAYCRLYKSCVPVDITGIAGKHPYDHAFVLDTLSGFDPRGETGRLYDRESSVELGNILEDVYREFGISVARIGEMPLEERAKYVKNSINLI